MDNGLESEWLPKLPTEQQFQAAKMRAWKILINTPWPDLRIKKFKVRELLEEPANLRVTLCINQVRDTAQLLCHMNLGVHTNGKRGKENDKKVPRYPLHPKTSAETIEQLDEFDRVILANGLVLKLWAESFSNASETNEWAQLHREEKLLKYALPQLRKGNTLVVMPDAEQDALS
jgi:hypothetical protein